GRAFQMGRDQAQEGDRRLPPRQALHQARTRDHGGGEGGRRRPEHERHARPRGAEGEGRLDAQGQHRARDRQGHRRGRRRRELGGRRLRGLRARRRRDAHRGDDRQPQPHGVGGPPHALQARRQPRRARLGRLPVRQARRHRHRRREVLRGRPHARRRGRRRGHRPGRHRLRGPHRARRAHRRARGAHRRRHRGRVGGDPLAAQDDRRARRGGRREADEAHRRARGQRRRRPGQRELRRLGGDPREGCRI
ncbi:MAG: Probable transcriptional regulatory protein YebC, partial [uncultured Solirubrobacteraceae bacterium]